MGYTIDKTGQHLDITDTNLNYRLRFRGGATIPLASVSDVRIGGFGTADTVLIDTPTRTYEWTFGYRTTEVFHAVRGAVAAAKSRPLSTPGAWRVKMTLTLPEATLLRMAAEEAHEPHVLTVVDGVMAASEHYGTPIVIVFEPETAVMMVPVKNALAFFMGGLFVNSDRPGADVTGRIGLRVFQGLMLAADAASRGQSGTVMVATGEWLPEAPPLATPAWR